MAWGIKKKSKPNKDGNKATGNKRQSSMEDFDSRRVDDTFNGDIDSLSDYDEDDEDDEDDLLPKRKKSKKKKPNKVIPIVVGTIVIAIVIGGIVFFINLSKYDDKKSDNKPGVLVGNPNDPQLEDNVKDTSGSKEETPPQKEDDEASVTGELTFIPTGSETPQDVAKPKPNPPTDVSAGAPNLNQNKNKQNDTPLTDSNQMLKDIKGQDISPKYEVSEIKRTTDFINYIKRRGSTGNGIEIFWLDAVYKGRPYTVQVPFKIFKELESEGITVVDIESLKTKEGNEIVSYMQVNENYKSILENKSKTNK